jgi:hypothetical protein
MSDFDFDFTPDGWPVCPGDPFNRTQVARTPETAVALLLRAWAEGLDDLDRERVAACLDDLEPDTVQPSGWAWRGDRVQPAAYLRTLRSLPPEALNEVLRRIREHHPATPPQSPQEGR